MEDSDSQHEQDETTMFLNNDEPEIYIATHENTSTANCNFENVEDESYDDNNRRRSKRTRNRNFRYKSEDDIISLSPEPEINNRKSSDKDFIIQEPSSSTNARLSYTKSNNMINNSNNMNKSDSYTGDALAKALKQIRLYDELYVLMKTRGITVEALKSMQPRHIDELFKGTRLGTKIIFEARLKEWQNRNDTEHFHMNEQLNSSISQVLRDTDLSNLANLLTNAVQNTITSVLEEFKQTLQKPPKDKPNHQLPIAIIPLKKIKVEPNNNVNETIIPDQKSRRPNNKLIKVVDQSTLTNQTLERTISPLPKRRKMDDNASVKDILMASPIGQKLFIDYDDSGSLNSNQRHDMLRCIIDYYLRNNYDLTIAQCKEISAEILELFPTEYVETYFLQDNRNSSPKGKIWEYYQNRKRRLRSRLNNNVTSKPQNVEEECLNEDLIDANSTNLTSPEMQAMCLRMKHIKNERELLEKWKESFAYRRNQLQTAYFSNWKLYFDEYPFCKQQNYTLFIESDLETLYPNLKFNDTLWNEFLENFPTYFANRIKHPKSKQLYDQLVAMENTSSNSEYVAIKVIELLHAVLKNPSHKLQTVEEAQRKFTVEVNDLAELKKVVIERKKYCNENSIQAKPYIAVVGQNKVYSHFSVILDSTGFSCDNYKDSLILCFNLYLFFDISFPHESLNVWTFIQKYFFNKPPLVRNARVESFINEIREEKTANMEMNGGGK